MGRDSEGSHNPQCRVQQGKLLPVTLERLAPLKVRQPWRRSPGNHIWECFASAPKALGQWKPGSSIKRSQQPHFTNSQHSKGPLPSRGESLMCQLLPSLTASSSLRDWGRRIERGEPEASCRRAGAPRRWRRKTFNQAKFINNSTWMWQKVYLPEIKLLKQKGLDVIGADWDGIKQSW